MKNILALLVVAVFGLTSCQNPAVKQAAKEIGFAASSKALQVGTAYALGQKIDVQKESLALGFDVLGIVNQHLPDAPLTQKQALIEQTLATAAKAVPLLVDKPKAAALANTIQAAATETAVSALPAVEKASDVITP